MRGLFEEHVDMFVWGRVYMNPSFIRNVSIRSYHLFIVVCVAFAVVIECQDD